MRSSTTVSRRIRKPSWLFTAKCLAQAPTPSAWMPRTSATAALPDSSGSSEKYSKLRPPAGWRLRFSPGPSSTPTSAARVSRPSARPTSSMSSTSHDDPSVTAVGKQVAGAASESPTWSPAPCCLRNPCGPSVSMIDGTPCSARALVCQKSAPETVRSLSSRDNRATTSRARSANDADVGAAVLDMAGPLGSLPPTGRRGARRCAHQNDRTGVDEAPRVVGTTTRGE